MNAYHQYGEVENKNFVTIHLYLSAISTIVQQCINTSVLSLLEIFTQLYKKSLDSGESGYDELFVDMLRHVVTSRQTLTSTTSDAFVFTRRHHVSLRASLTRRIWLLHQVFTLTSVAIVTSPCNFQTSFLCNFQNDGNNNMRVTNPEMSRSLSVPAAGERHPAQSTV